MPGPIKSIITSGCSARCIIKRGFFLNISLLALLTSFATAYPRANNPLSQESNTETRMLEKSKPIERELAGGEIHSYSFALNPNQYARVYVDQRGIGVVVKVFGQNGETFIEADI